MTIAQIAREFNVTEQAVRNRIVRAGLSLAELRRPDSFEFSESGEKVVMDLMKRPPAERKKGKTTDPKERQKAVTALRSELAAAQQAAVKAEATVAAQAETITILREELRDLKALLAAQQAAQALPDPTKEPKSGWFSRFREKFRKS